MAELVSCCIIYGFIIWNTLSNFNDTYLQRRIAMRAARMMVITKVRRMSKCAFGLKAGFCQRHFLAEVPWACWWGKAVPVLFGCWEWLVCEDSSVGGRGSHFGGGAFRYWGGLQITTNSVFCFLTHWWWALLLFGMMLKIPRLPYPWTINQQQPFSLKILTFSFPFYLISSLTFFCARGVMHLEMSSDSARVLPAIQMIGYPTTMTFLKATMMRTSVSY